MTSSIRSPLPIGSTMPGALPEAEAERRPGIGRRRAERQARLSLFRDLPRLPRGEVLHFGVRFDGTGDDYARVWFGNLLLLLITAGLAWPWTHCRQQRYLLEHTELAGHRFGFRLSARDLWPRMIMVLVLWLGVAGAMAGSWHAGMVALTVAGLTWPLMAYLSIDQRVGAVSWAGRRLWFDGPWHGVYRSAGVPLALCLTAGWMVVMGWGTGSGLGRALLVLAGFAAVGCAPFALWRFLQYRQEHLRLGPLRLLWTARRADVASALGGSALRAALVGVLFLLVSGASGVFWQQYAGQRLTQGQWLLLWLVAGAGGVAVFIPMAQARLINLAWNKTGSRYLRIRSNLSIAAYTGLMFGQAVALVCTLGLYWPWARVARWQQRTESLVVASRLDPETLLAYWSSRQSDAPPTVLAAQPSPTPPTRSAQR